MPDEAQASRLFVLSDLHLAPRGEQRVFAAHEALTSLIDHLADAPASQPSAWLVLNGDVFDYLQIDDYDALSLRLAPGRTTRLLDALDAEPPERNIVRALRRFTANGHRLSCLPGNHDAELNLASVQDVLAERLGSNSILPASAGSWQLSVAGQHVVGRHGHYGDAFNAITGTQMRQAQADGDDTVPMPPGSRLVLDAINPFRRAKNPDGTRRFPFVDRLPSDYAVVLAIMLLDPRLAGKRLKDAIGVGAAALVRKAMMLTSRRGPVLGAGAPTGKPTSGQPGWIDELAGFMAIGDSAGVGESVRANHLEFELDAYFSTLYQPEQRSTETLGGGGAVRALLWQALARALNAARGAFRSDVPDGLANDTTSTWGQGVVAITGHTHAAKYLRAPDGGTYINTGTWLDQVVPPDDLPPDKVPAWLARLQRDELPCWNGHPVAVVDGDGARLMTWSGVALDAWKDATS